MRVHSREIFVGFLLVLGLFVMACQPVQPVSELSVAPSREAIVKSDSVTKTVTLSETTMASAVSETMELIETSAAGGTGSSVPSEQAVAADPAVMAAGLEAYRAQYCGVCHTLDAAETRGTFGPPHNGMGATAALYLADPNYHGTATAPAEYIRESIVDPQAFTVPGYATTSHRMPSYSFLDAETLDALVAFLMAQ